MADNAPRSPTPSPTATTTTPAKPHVKKVPRGQSKRSTDGMFKVGIWWKNHRLNKMFYFYSDKKGDYDRELSQVVASIERQRQKIEYAYIYEVGDSNRGPVLLGFRNDEFYQPQAK